MIDEELFEGFASIDPAGQTEDISAELSGIPACKGVLLFADSQENPIQLLIAANLRRTARARILGAEEDTPTKRPDITRIANRIYYKCCYNNFLSTLEHYNIAKRLFGNNYKDAVTLPKLSLVKIDPSAKWPNFSHVSSMTAGGDEKVFGPFPSRKSSGEFIGILEKAFSLCMRPDIVDNPEKAASCPYLQMDICPGPCVGNITKERYLRQIDMAIIAASGHREHLYTILTKEMEKHAEKMEFEQASEIKDKIEQLKQLDTATFNWTGDLENMSILHIDKSNKIKVEGKRGKTQTFAAFYITAGNIQALEPFTLENIEDFYAKIPDLKGSVGMAHPTNPKTANELLALTSYFLYRSSTAGQWIDLTALLPTLEELKTTLEQ